MLGYDLRTESLKIKREVGYMTQKFSFYEDLTIAENLRIRGAALRAEAGRRACRPDARGTRPDLAARPARRHAVGRLEAAAGAGRLHHAQAEAAAARRADRRRRPQGAARILGRDPPPGARRADRAGLDPLHGRGRALPPHQLHLLWQDAGERHASTRWSTNAGLTTFVVEGPRLDRGGGGARGQGRASSRSRRSARRCMSSAPTRQLLEAALAGHPQDATASPSSRGETSLEDVFIQFMAGVEGQYGMNARVLLRPARRAAASRNSSRCGATASPSP